ncbi:MAG: HAD family hydrolase [Ethanoligenens sp.]
MGFDLGYTLVHTHRELIFQKAIEQMGIHRKIDEIFKAYHLSDKLIMREFPGTLIGRREEFMPFYFQKLLGYLQIYLDLQSVLTEFFRQEEIQSKSDGGAWFAYESVASVLSMLKRRGIRRILISNWDDTAIEILKQNGIFSLLDQIVISSEVKISKPDQRIFELALFKAGVKPEHTLYVGDNYYNDYIGASCAGLKFVLINHIGR